MTIKRKEKIQALLKSIETGELDAISVVNPEKYVQHNPQTEEGGEGLAELFKRLSKTSPKVNIVRIFEDGDYVFAHTEYDFGTSRVGFEIFRFEGAQTVEHWDNIQARKGPNSLGYDMVSGETQVFDKNKTEVNRKLIRFYVDKVLLGKQFDSLESCICKDLFVDHSPENTGNFSSLKASLEGVQKGGDNFIEYSKNHRILADGEFVLSVSEGKFNTVHSAFFDLFRLREDKIIERWNTIESIPPKAEWKNENGKFNM